MVKWRGLLFSALVIGMICISGCTRTPAAFVDDFSDPASGWGAASHETYVRGYQQGEYLIQIDVPHWFVWATAGYAYDDVQIDAAVRSAGQRDNHFGLICRYDDQNFYYFAISTDGYYGIFRHESDGTMQMLTGDDMLYSPLIQVESNGGHIRAVCEDNLLTLYVNGQLLVEIEDKVLTKGDIGMAAGTVKNGGSSIWFDDFEVSKP